MRLISILLLTILIISCGAPKETVRIVELPEVNVEFEQSAPEYKASIPRKHDLIHSKVAVSFDWEKQELKGLADLQLRPYFHSTNQLYLNAKGMDIHKVQLLSNNMRNDLPYNYSNDTIWIILDKKYSRVDTFEVSIKYTAKPEDLVSRNPQAFSSAKGLFFINPNGLDKNKPRQIWTQGETQSSSCWFPTIDAPNERMTQEIIITIEDNFKTLSNGKMISSIKNNDGTRTDHWKQSLPAAPYLTMMAIGEYEITFDKWRDLDVNYYMEPDYGHMGKRIYGNTPEMMEYFSKLLGVDYPWEKYSQVVVRDYVSGAMENTSAVIYGEFMNQDERELLDYDNEDVISHELFHHWFGDLVTCESWANLPLNESFATYGEYLWNEKKYGKLKADHYGHNDLQAYIRESKVKKEPLIRYYHDHQDHMFDAHSYQKGGRVLHMLRNYMGDDAFFNSLRVYLEDNKYESVEIHNLRLACEKVSGEDLNWFFNQWFLNSGHPFIDISYSYDDSLKIQTVTIEQLQDIEEHSLFMLPIAIDVYESDVPTRYNVTVRKQIQDFQFKVKSKPNLVNVDADKMLLCEKIDHKTSEEYIYQYYNAGNYLDRREAIANIGRDYEIDGSDGRMIKRALSDPYWHLRLLAIRNLDEYIKEDPQEMKEILSYMATRDSKSLVRAEALEMLAKHYKNDMSIEHIFKNATVDSSYTVLEQGLLHFTYLNNEAGLRTANKYAAEENPKYIPILSKVYSYYGDDSHHLFFDYAFRNASGNEKYSLLRDYGLYLTRCNVETIENGLAQLKMDAIANHQWYVRLAAVEALAEIKEHAVHEKKKLESEIKSSATSSIMKKDAEIKVDRFTKLELAIDEALKSIMKNERHSKLVEMYNKG
ncbi:MAG: M1 family metallopeptidase [Bacteroidia bacterium]|nr:M1 family metallopeptidase [Bacteroidia bacterium]